MDSDKNKRIVVTGATGLIGSQLVQVLSKRGDHVIAFVRDPENDASRVPGAAEYVKWSAKASEGMWKEKIDGADGIVNLAGAPIAKRWTEEWKKIVRDSRVLGTRHIVEAISAAKAKPKVLVQGSAVGYYGALVTASVTEHAPHGDDFMGRLCWDWEQEALQANDHDVRVVTIRTGVVLDPEGGALKEMMLPFKFFVGGPIGSGKQPWPWIHRDDEIGLLLHALDNTDVSGPLNGVAPESINNRHFSKELGHVLGRPSLFPVPHFVLRIMFGEGSVAVTGGQNVVPERTLASGYQFQYPEIRSALKNLIG